MASSDEVWGAVPADSEFFPAAVITANVGYMGRMVSGSKVAPKGQECVWNANVIVDGKKVWYGDLNLTKDEKHLQKCANIIGKPLYILREMDARFDNEKNPKLDKAVKVFTPVKKD